MFMRIKKEHLILFLILIVGALIRFYLFFNETFIGTDAVSYVRLGKNLIDNGKYVFGEDYNRGIFFPPGYPLLVGLFNIFIKNLIVTGKLISLLSSVATIFISYLIGKEIYNKESGLFAAFVCAIHPTLLDVSTMVTTESLFICLLMLSIYVSVLSINNPRFIYFILLGVLTGMAYLTRSEGMLLMLLPFLYLFVTAAYKDKRQFTKIFTTIIIFILIASPYVIFLKKNTGKFNLSGKSDYLAYLVEQGLTGPGLEFDELRFSLNKDKTRIKAFTEPYQTSSIHYLIKDKRGFIRKYLSNAKEEADFILKMLFPLMLPLFFSFFDRSLFKRRKIIFVLCPLVFLLIYPMLFIDERQILLTILSFILFLSIGFANAPQVVGGLLDYYKIRRNKVILFFERYIKHIIIVMVVLRFLQFSPNSNEIPAEHIRAGNFLKRTIPSQYEKLNIMSRMPWVSFYSHARLTSLPYSNPVDVVVFAKAYNVDYIVIDARTLKGWEFYSGLINMEKYSEAVELIYEDDSERLIKIFKVKYK